MTTECAKGGAVSDTAKRARPVETLDRVVIRFAGDSGDGMQLTGDRFTTSSAVYGNDLATLPDFPAEIRAPAGTLAGVSAFQVHISDHDITTPGDAPTVLVAMNPAALRSQVGRVANGATIIVNVDAFDDRSLSKAGYDKNPLEDGSLDGFTVYEVPMTSLTKGAVQPLGVKPRDAERSKNFFALGLVSWMYTRPVERTLDWIEARFGKSPQIVAANIAAFKAGHAFGETAELFDHPYEVKPAPLPAGTYTNSRGTPPWRGAWSPPASCRGCRCSSAPIRSRRPATSSTSCRSTRTSASAPSRPRTRSPASAPHWARPTAGTSA